MAVITKKTPVHWEVFFEGIPDWVIPLIKVIPEFYTDNEHSEQWNELSLTYSFNYIWEKVDNKNYRLSFRLSGLLEDNENNPLPLFVNLSLWIINTNYRHSVQHNMGY